MVIGARTRERFGSILSDFLHGIKAKGYDVIGVHVFVPSLMRFLPKKGWFTEPYTSLRTLVLSFSTLHGRWIVNRVISIGLHGSTWFVISTLKYLAVWFMFCLVPVPRFPSLSRSIRFGDVSEAHGPRDPKRFGHEEKWGLGTRQVYVIACLSVHNALLKGNTSLLSKSHTKSLMK